MPYYHHVKFQEQARPRGAVVLPRVRRHQGRLHVQPPPRPTTTSSPTFAPPFALLTATSRTFTSVISTESGSSTTTTALPASAQSRTFLLLYHTNPPKPRSPRAQVSLTVSHSPSLRLRTLSEAPHRPVASPSFKHMTTKISRPNPLIAVYILNNS